MNKYKPFSLAAILALIFTLSACAEQILETAADDPEPDTTSGETSYVTSQVLAQNSADDERSPQANDITLGSYNNSDTNTSNDINGQSNLMPIRIPFSGAITNLYNSDGSLNTTSASSYISNIAIFKYDSSVSSVTSALVPLPTFDRAGNDISSFGGTFQAVYQDSNHDLVLVPSISTFSSSSATGDVNYSYFVLVNKNLNGSDGQNLIPDTLTKLLTTSSKLIDDANTTIYSSLLEDINDNNVTNDANDRASVASLEAARRGYVGENGDGGMLLATKNSAFSSLNFNFNSGSDIASVFHFTTSAASADADNNNVLDFNDAVNGVLSLAASVNVTQSIVWLNSDMNETTADKVDLKTTMSTRLGSSYDLSSVNEIYKGFFTCTNFLENEGNDTATRADKWDLNSFAKLAKYSAGSITASDLADCPNSLSSVSSSLTGTIGFWAVKPSSPTGVVVFQHGILGNKDHLFSIANTLAGYGFSSLAIDTWGHGERTYEDGDGDGTLENTMDSNYSDSGALFIRPDAPDLTAGYMWQTMIDMYRLANMAKSNSDVQGATGVASITNNLHFVGVSLGGIHGTSFANLGISDSSGTRLFAGFSDPFTKYVLNVTGGDVGDVIFSGSFGASVRNSVARSQGYDTSTVAGQQSLNSTMVAIDLLAAHAVFGLGTDPLAFANTVNPTNVLLQEMTGDETVPNNNTEILNQAMKLSSYSDGNSSVNTSTTPRLRWTFNPSNYDTENDGGPAGHGFLLNGESNATSQGQLQVACYLRDGVVLNPAATISSACSN